jgi:hypothetical protein
VALPTVCIAGDAVCRLWTDTPNGECRRHDRLPAVAPTAGWVPPASGLLQTRDRLVARASTEGRDRGSHPGAVVRAEPCVARDDRP